MLKEHDFFLNYFFLSLGINHHASSAPLYGYKRQYAPPDALSRDYPDYPAYPEMYHRIDVSLFLGFVSILISSLGQLFRDFGEEDGHRSSGTDGERDRRALFQEQVTCFGCT